MARRAGVVCLPAIEGPKVPGFSNNCNPQGHHDSVTLTATPVNPWAGIKWGVVAG